MTESEKTLKFLLAQGEGHNLEYKTSFSDGIAEAMCGFANANGGKILLGIRDDGTRAPIKLTNVLRARLQDVAHNLDPSLKVTVRCVDEVVIVDVPEGGQKPYSTHGKFFLRHGAATQQLRRDEIRGLFQQENLVLFDEKLNYDFDIRKDLKKMIYRGYLKRASISDILPAEDTLVNLGVVRNDRMRNAGILLFSDDVTKFFRRATVTCLLLQGTSKVNILDRKEFAGDVISAYESTIEYLKSKLNTRYIIKDAGPRIEQLELPEEALREAVINAITHRDYFVSGAGIMVEIYADRVEIVSPGGLVKGMTVNDLGRRSISRNNLLFGLLQRADLVEMVGSGFVRMRNAMAAQGLAGPRVEVDENWFTMVFDRLTKETTQDVAIHMGQDVPQMKAEGLTQKVPTEIVEMIRRNPDITIPDIAAALNVTERTVHRQLERLRQSGLLSREGSRKTGRWNALPRPDIGPEGKEPAT